MRSQFVRCCAVINVIILGLLIPTGALYAENEATEQASVSPQEKMFNLVVKRLETADTIERKRAVANDLMSYGDLLDDRIDADLKVKFYDTIVKNFEQSSDEALTERVAEAQLSIAMVLGNNHNDEKAIAIIDRFLARFGQYKQAPFPHLICFAYIGKGHFLADHDGNYNEAIAAYSEIIKKSHEFPAEDISLHFRLIEALFLTAELQEKQKKINEAVLSLNEIEKRYAHSTSDDLKQQVEKATYKRSRLLDDAKKTH